MQLILVKNIKKIIDIISYLSAWKAIEVQSPELNKQEIQIIANNLRIQYLFKT
jgi:hypothetical protein